MHNSERRIMAGRDVEYRALANAARRQGEVTYQVWVVLADGRHVLIAQTQNCAWAARFVRMVPASSEAGKIGVVIVESNGAVAQSKNAGAKSVVPAWRGPRQSRLQRQKGGRIDWASYGNEE